MPAGVAVGTLAIGVAGAKNAVASRPASLACETRKCGVRCRNFVSAKRKKVLDKSCHEGEQPILPGATIGVMGGGQLGRMFALAARRMGYRVHTFSPEKNGPAAQVSDRATAASYHDEARGAKVCPGDRCSNLLSLRTFQRQRDRLGFARSDR